MVGGGGGGGGGEEDDRHQIMQNLFGDQSEEEEEDDDDDQSEEEEDEDVESHHESNPIINHPDYASSDGAEPEREGEAEVDGPEAAEVESEGELHEAVESEGEQDQEVVVPEEREESDGKESESDERDGYGDRVAARRSRDVIESGSEKSEENHYVNNEDEEVGQTRSLSRSPGEEKDEVLISSSAPEIRDVFGDSDEEEPVEYTIHENPEEDFNRTNLEEEEDFDRDLKPEDMIADEEAQYESDEGNLESRIKEKPLGPPLELEIPFRPPPATTEKINMVKVSNIMGIAQKPFDPKTFAEEEEVFVTDESESKKRIRLDDNIVRWRVVRKPDGTKSYESNARFVRWSDGSLQLLIGNEVLDISVQDARHDQAHLFLRHGKGILQSQGRILSKMKFMPSSLSSKSHRLLTALVDSQHKKVYKVKNCFTHIDPEKEKEQKEKVLNETIRANELLNRKKEKVHRKYTPTTRRERQLSPGFLEEALEEPEEGDEEDYYESRRSGGRRRFDEDIEMEARAEKRLANAKKGQKEIPRKSTFTPKSSRRPVDFSESDREESEYETEEEEEEEENPLKQRRLEKQEDEDEDEDEGLDEEEVVANEESEEDPEEPKQKGRESGDSLKRKGIESDEESPPRKTPATHRRMAIVYDSDEE